MWPLARVAIGAGVLTLLWFAADGEAVVARLRDFDPYMAAAALGITVPQVVLSAWRWRFTARRLGAVLGLGQAIREYYLATFLNQVLPGGVTGDATRALRHGVSRRREMPDGQDSGRTMGPAVRAVVLERASGQAALLLVVLAGAAFWPRGGLGLPAVEPGDLVVAGLAALGLLAVLGGMMGIGAVRRQVRHLGVDARRAFAVPGPLIVQMGGSLLVVASYIAVYALAARAIGIELPGYALVTVVPVVLFSMVIPVSVAGWGVREAVAALLAQVAGLGITEAVGVSVAYGLLVLVSALPGAVVLLAGRPRRQRESP